MTGPSYWDFSIALGLADIDDSAHTGTVQPESVYISVGLQRLLCPNRLGINDHRYAKAARGCLTGWRSAALSGAVFGSEESEGSKRNPIIGGPVFGTHSQILGPAMADDRRVPNEITGEIL